MKTTNEAKKAPAPIRVASARRYTKDAKHPYGYEIGFYESFTMPDGKVLRVWASALGIDRANAIAHAAGIAFATAARRSPEYQEHLHSKAVALRVASVAKYNAASPSARASADKYATLTGKARKQFRVARRDLLREAGAISNPLTDA